MQSARSIAFSLFLISLSFFSGAQSLKSFDIFSYSAPKNFLLKETQGKLLYTQSAAKQYCQLYLYPAVTGQSDVEKDFAANWDFFARNPAQGVTDPESKEKQTQDGWDMITGSARGSYSKKPFVISVTTVTRGALTYYIAAVFTSEKYIPVIREFMAGITPDTNRFVQGAVTTPVPQPSTVITPASNTARMSKPRTQFDDGWLGTALDNYVQLVRNGTEIRLHYIDAALDDTRPQTIDAPEYYWSKYVTPYFNVASPQKWAGVQYPVIYFMEGNAVNKQTGRSCYVAIKIVYSGGARPIVVIAPDQQSYQQQFPHPNDLDAKLNANRFAVTAADLVGKWSGSGGGGVEYYNAYSGTYAGMSAVSSTDEFVFHNNGTYSSSYRGASMNNGGTQFSGQDFKGNFSVTDWSVTATNRLGGKTTIYNAQLIAVKNGYLLYLSDQDNPSMHYTLYRVK